ncbi:unnamed protein product [Bursaphelenchus xylophilus]|uniref:(pine wood nematode) hypothetical protein n=1 Tax=Bursaphelenchus xylophilus TaxID=6326 RepID=A0A1I7S9E1_BURXY|nr:unnamed protein product [Bursaphelenchus xylophilus]CAG9100553.1 unnamed protein product [Bursaphelenchus xylophilus]
MIVLFLAALVSLASAGIKEDHEVKDLPGLNGTLSFKQYAGYFSISPTRKLAYWLLESQGNPNKDPLMLWLDGGPGCSSLSGILLENGPFRISTAGKPDGVLYENPHAYNKFANVLYLEAPAGVGFSRLDDDKFSFTDNETATDNLKFLQEFLKAYSEYENRDFFISGISYAGCYVPHLADTIINHKDEIKLNLKGIAMGNAITDQKWLNQLSIPNTAFYGILRLNKLNEWTNEYCPTGFENFCGKEVAQSPTANVPINRYDFADQCGPDCEEPFMQAFLNNHKVKDALHFEHKHWTHCNESLMNTFFQNLCDDAEALVRDLLAHKIRVLYYFGTTDNRVPFISGDFFARKIGGNGELTHWFVNGVYSGTKTHYPNNITFTTVLGAGHPSAKHKPQQVANVIQKFISGDDNWDA